MLASKAVRPFQLTERTTLPLLRGLATSKDTASTQPSKDDKDVVKKAQDAADSQKSTQHKTVAEQDRELMEKLAGHNDEGGAAGVEYEDGKPVAQKRSVKNNMFRLI